MSATYQKTVQELKASFLPLLVGAGETLTKLHHLVADKLGELSTERQDPSLLRQISEAQAESSGDQLASRRVVLVDDSADARATLADVLEMMGHHVLVAADGPEALRLAWEEQPEAYIVDIGLPGMNGFEVAQQLRQIPGGDERLLIALSGYGSPEDKRAGAGSRLRCSSPETGQDRGARAAADRAALSCGRLIACLA